MSESQAYEEKSDSGCKECISQVADGSRPIDSE